MQRRFFLHSAAAAATAPLSAAAAKVEAMSDGQPTIDVNVSLERWPFGRLRFDQANTLTDQLRQTGISQAWAGSYEALLHRDLDAVNQRLVATCRSVKESLFKPMGAVNPKAPNWEATLDRCANEHRMIGIRLHPDFHGYRLDDPDFLALLTKASKRQMVVQIAIQKVSPACQHPAIRVSKVDPKPLLEKLPTLQGARIQLLNAWNADLKLASELGNMGVQFDLATQTPESIGKLLNGGFPSSALVFGTGAPQRPIENALQNLRDSDLASSEAVAIRCHNVENLLTLA